MLKLPYKRIGTGLILLAVWLIFECSISWFAFCDKQINNQGGAYQAAEKNICIFNGPLSSTTQFVIVRVGAMFNRADDYIALFTAVLSISTLALWWATYKSLKLARHEFMATHRPQVRVRRINLQGSRDDFGSFIIHLSNAGESDAIIRLIGCGMARKNNGAWLGDQPPDPRGSGVIRPDDPVLPMGPSRPFLLAVAVDEQARAAIREDRHKLFVVGEIEYSDRSGIIRNTGFCWVYDHGIRDFRQSKEDEEYNYED